MDIIYTTTDKNVNDYIELRYSLRSLFYFVPKIRYVYIIGPVPEWIRNIRNIMIPDMEQERSQNVHLKLMQAASDPNITEQFLYVADDMYFTAPVEPLTYPFFSLGPISNDSSWLSRFLQMIEKPRDSYKAHTPLRISKSQYIQTPWEYIQTEAVPIRNMYCNYWEKEPTYCVDPILITNYSESKVKEVGATTHVISGGDKSPEFEAYKRTMEKLYPEKSCFEL